jgi:hypothetical protein
VVVIAFNLYPPYSLTPPPKKHDKPDTLSSKFFTMPILTLLLDGKVVRHVSVPPKFARESWPPKDDNSPLSGEAGDNDLDTRNAFDELGTGMEKCAVFLRYTFYNSLADFDSISTQPERYFIPPKRDITDPNEVEPLNLSAAPRQRLLEQRRVNEIQPELPTLPLFENISAHMTHIRELREQIYDRLNNVAIRIRGLEHSMESFEESWGGTPNVVDSVGNTGRESMILK